MTKQMLIDATHPEETRVAVVDGHRLEEFDSEIAAKKPLKGNIYLAKITRVEPSLQAAFVEYGGNRHGFLAFSEIHPDYYRIPVADREALLAELDRDDGETDGEADAVRRKRKTRAAERPLKAAAAKAVEEPAETPLETAGNEPMAADAYEAPSGIVSESAAQDSGPQQLVDALPLVGGGGWAVSSEPVSLFEPTDAVSPAGREPAAEITGSAEETIEPAQNTVAEVSAVTEIADFGGEPVASSEGVASDELEEGRRWRARQIRRYKIQEVIKRRQIMLVQVTKEERSNKGAALTTFLSLAGRYCVLMPNTPRGGGISRKITSPNDRKRLKSIIDELEIPDGIAVIVRTAGSERNKAEIKRDYEYLLRLWDEIRELTLRSTSPQLVYEEAILIKRAIRDLYSKDIEDILVEGEEGYKSAKSFMKMLTPSHAKRVQLYKDPTVPLFHRYQVESQIDLIHQPVVQLRSGGYIVLNQTEALVAIDVNSGRATRERHIEETALKTNLEAADEVARQLRLRDLAGLIVIDFIDMEDQRHNTQVERRLKEALKDDRARIQMGHISHFGLLEMSRQRLRPSLIETSTVVCRHCGGTGHVRSTESTALHLLRAFEEEGIRKRSSEITVSAPTAVALYILNQKREALTQIEHRYGLRILLAADDSLIPPDFRMERTRPRSPEDDRAQPPVSPDVRHIDAPELEDEEKVEAAEVEAEAEEKTAAEGRGEEGESAEEQRRRRPRRRRRRRGDDAAESRPTARAATRRKEDTAEQAGNKPDAEASESVPEAGGESDAGAQERARKRRRRGKRGGRRRRGEPREVEAGSASAGKDEPASSADARPEGGSVIPAVESAPAIAADPEPIRSAPETAERSWSDTRPRAVADDRAAPEPAPAIARQPEARAAEKPEDRPEPRPAEERASAGAGGREMTERPRRRGWWQRVLE